MSFDLLPPIDVVSDKRLRGLDPKLLHKAQCTICPLNHCRSLKHPHMPAHGPRDAMVYMLGEAPGEEEDRIGRPFVGPSGQLLRSYIPSQWSSRLRWNNVVRTRPPDNRQPTQVETECCRPSVISDIEQTKPKAIFGFGNVPLHWVIRQTGISKWRGRRLPVKIGSHTTWYFPIEHPASILHKQGEYGADDAEFVLAFDLHQAFTSLDKLPPPQVLTREDAESTVRWVTGQDSNDLDTVVSFLAYCSGQETVGLDYETNGHRPYGKDSKILTVSLSSDKDTLAFPLHHRQALWSPRQLQMLQSAWADFLHDAPCMKVAHAAAFEMEWSAAMFGPDCLRATLWADTMGQAFVLDERMHMSKPDALSLEFLVLQYFGLNIKDLSPLDRKRLDEASLPAVLRYNGIDAKFHWMLYHAQQQRLQDDSMLDVYDHHMRRTTTMVLTQLKGVPVNKKTRDSLHKKYTSKVADIDKRIASDQDAMRFRKRFGHDYRPGVPADGQLLLRMLGLHADNADAEAFALVKEPIGKLTTSWRKHAKVLSTYIAPMFDPEIVWPDGLMHPIISTCQTRTSRTSSEDPNIQNWIKHQGESNEIRSQVAAPSGYKLVAFDYSGIQARNVAMESKDASLVEAFRNRYDIHSDWRDTLIKIYPQWIVEGSRAYHADIDLSKEYRHKAKNRFVFPAFFGVGAKKVSDTLHIPLDIAYDLLDRFWDKFPNIKSWQNGLHQMYREDGYVTGLSGYRRHCPVAHTEIINTPIQADEAVIVCDAQDRLSCINPDHLQAILMVHDDLTFLFPVNRVDEYSDIVIKETIVNVPFAWTRIVPLGIEMSIGDSWDTLKKVGTFESFQGGAYTEIT